MKTDKKLIRLIREYGKPVTVYINNKSKPPVKGVSNIDLARLCLLGYLDYSTDGVTITYTLKTTR